MYAKMSFQRIRYKNYRVAFRLLSNLLQTSWAAEIAQRFPQAPGFLHRRHFYFVDFGADNINLTKSDFTAYIGLSLLVGGIDNTFPGKNIYQNTQKK